MVDAQLLPLNTMSDLTQEYVKTLFDYKDGVFVHKTEKARGKIKVGDKVGSLTSDGYYRVMIDYKEYRLHKIIFLWHHGYMPKNIDHINRNTLDNRIENLRESNSITNAYNRRKPKSNTSGCKNVSWSKKYNQWQIHIRANKKTHCYYAKDFELAELIAIEARNLLHGKFACHV